jgi:hypothetical protein
MPAVRHQMPLAIDVARDAPSLHSVRSRKVLARSAMTSEYAEQ